MGCSSPGSSIHRILQARILEWVAISFSNAWKWKVKVKSLSHVQLLETPWTAAYLAPPSMGIFQGRVLEWGAIAFPGHVGEFWQNVVHCRRKWQTTSVFLHWEPHEQYEKAKGYDTERWNPQVSRCPYATGEEQRNNSRKNEEAEPKQKQDPVVDVTGGESKVWCCKEQYWIGTWNVRSMNQGKLGKLDVVK